MTQKNTPRIILISFVLLVAVWALWPTIKYFSLSEEEKLQKKEDGTLLELEKKSIHLGLDLKGGMHLVLETDVPKLIETIAVDKNDPFYSVLHKAENRFKESGEDFISLFLQEGENQNVTLKRYFPDLMEKGDDLGKNLRDETIDAIDRIRTTLQNRVDEFGVSEPVIQKQGDFRIVAELAGIDNPERARQLIQKTGALEFILLKDPEITQGLLTRIDNNLKGSKGISEALTSTDKSQANQEKQKTEKQDEVSITDLFGETPKESVSEEDTAGAAVDKELFTEKPFSSLLRNAGGDMMIPVRNVRAFNTLLNRNEIKSLLDVEESQILLSANSEEVQTVDGKREFVYRVYHVENKADLTGGVIIDADATLSGSGSMTSGQPIVELAMNSEGTKIWSRLTGANINRRLAIVLDKKVHIAPVIRNKITEGRSVIEGTSDMDEAKDIAVVLRAGALPAPVNIIEERTIGPSLGEDSIKLGIYSGLIGMSLVVLFIIVYYKWSGVIANFGLVWNIILTLAALAMLKATLSLPGIAGLILTVGMSIDANVLIFERIREELEKGKSISAAIDTGYSRALIAIIDSNVTNLLAALVLMQFGTGPIKGFAVTLFWGITISMFTAVFATRTVFNIIASRQTVKTLSI